MRILLPRPLLKWLLAVLVGTTTFSFALLRRTESDERPGPRGHARGRPCARRPDPVPRLPRPVPAPAAARGGRRLRRAERAGGRFERGARRRGGARDAGRPAARLRAARASPRASSGAHGAGAIQALDGRGLVRYARANGCRLVLRHAVGDFVPEGAALVEVYGNDPGADAERRLRGMIALGDERTIEQDPAFAIRIMVDIANQGAVSRGQRPDDRRAGAQPPRRHAAPGGLDPAAGPSPGTRAGSGEVLVPVRRWEEFLSLGVTEIREYGALVRPGHAAAAGRARGAPRVGASGAPRGRRRGARTARRDRRPALRRNGRSRSGKRPPTAQGIGGPSARAG